MIRLLIADDHAMFREGLKQIIDDFEDILVVEEAGTASEVISKILQNDIDVILLDISMPGRSGMDIIRQIKELKPHVNILVLSMYSEDQYAVRALQQGASGYLTKNAASKELITAVRKVAKGEKYITTLVAEQLAYALNGFTELPKHKVLSNREFEVMCMIASGKTVTEIARELFLSVNTISTVRARILKKMKMNNNADMMRYALKEGLIN